MTPVPGETLAEYAGRLLYQIKTEKSILVGLSFGGMMAIEVSKLIITEKVILIASAKTRSEIPFYFRVAGKLKLHKLIPASFLKQANFFSYWFFGIKGSDKKLLKEILNETDKDFLTWAIDKIVKWKNFSSPENLIHIHGSADRILPIKFVNSDIRLKGAGHFLTVNRAVEINTVLKKLL